MRDYVDTMELDYLDDFEMEDESWAYEDDLYDDESWEDEGGLYDQELWEYESEGDFYDDESWEYEDEYEADLFWGSIKRGIGKLVKKGKRAIKKVARSPMTKRLLKKAARWGVTALGGALGGPAGAALANRVGSAVIREAEYEGDFELEYEDEYMLEAEYEDAGGDLEALYEMEAYAEMAAEAESEAEADRCVVKIARIASKRLPTSKRKDIAKGILASGQVLSATPRTRCMIPAVTKAATKTATTLSKRSMTGRPATSKDVTKIMSAQLAKNIATPKRLAKTIRNNKKVARKARVARRRPAMGSRRTRLNRAR